MQNSSAISIVCICDNHYAILLAALIKSIESNHHTQEKIAFYIVDDQISGKNRERIDASIDPQMTTIHWMKMENCLPEGAKLPIDKSSLPLNIYVRLFIPSFIPADLQKVIFLDVDMIVLEDISKLWHTDLGNNIVAAVQDQFIQIVSRWGGIANYQQFNLDPETKYFNAGLLVMDIKKWKEQNITDEILLCLDKNKENAKFQDQYGLNAVLANKWLELDPLWNRFAYSKEDRPYLIHFTGRKPIYKTYEFSENYKKLFYQYLQQTEWKNFKPIGEFKRNLKKIANILEKFTQKASAK